MRQVLIGLSALVVTGLGVGEAVAQRGPGQQGGGRYGWLSDYRQAKDQARKEGKPPSRYTTTRNKKLQTEKLELMKYNRFLRRHTLHREIK